MMRKFWQLTQFPFLVTAFILFGALFLFSGLEEQYFLRGWTPWQSGCCDPGDYRYLAEHFYGVPHDPASYLEPDWHGNWAVFLSKVPFRDIAIGSYTLALKALFPEHLGVAGPLSLRVILSLSYALFFVFALRRYGALAAFFSLAILALPPWPWALAKDLFPEAFLRVFFVLLLCPLIALRKDFRNALPCVLTILLLLLILAHTKIQWMLYSFLLLPALLIPFLHTRRIGAAAIVALGVLAIPVSLSLVHLIGWGDARIVQGSSLHAMLKTDWQNLAEACDTGAFEGYTPRFCTTREFRHGSWGHFLANQEPDHDLQRLTRDLDRASMRYFLRRPAWMLEEFLKGLRLSTNVPGWRPFESFAWLIDGFSVIVLLLGFLRRETFLLSSAALGLWIIQAVGHVFAVYDLRYHQAMAGIPLVAALLITPHVFSFALHILRNSFSSMMLIPRRFASSCLLPGSAPSST